MPVRILFWWLYAFNSSPTNYIEGTVTDSHTEASIHSCTVAFLGKGVGGFTDTAGCYKFYVPDSLLNRELMLAFAYPGYDRDTVLVNTSELPQTVNAALTESVIRIIGGPIRGIREGSNYVEGTVRDESGEPVFGAIVRVPYVTGTLTNDRGYYKLYLPDSLKQRKIALEYVYTGKENAVRKVCPERLPKSRNVRLKRAVAKNPPSVID